MRTIHDRAAWLGALGALLTIAGCTSPTVVPMDDAGTDAGSVRDAGRDAPASDTGTPDGGGDPCATGCLVGTTCHPDGTVNPTNPCEICDRAASSTSFSPNDGASCDDGLFCTTDDECSAGACGGTPLACDDGIACNGEETCDESGDACEAGTPTCSAGELCDATSGLCVTTCPGCAIGGSCYGNGQVNPSNRCEVCDTSMSRSAFSDNDGATCDDGLFCTTVDVCAGGACGGGGAPRCGDDVDCNGVETCDESMDRCAAGATTCAASEVCDVASDTCVATCTGCVVGGTCFGAGQRNPANQCEICAPAISRSSFSPNDGATCDDGVFCTTGDVCTGTTCAGPPRACSDGIACNGTETCSEAAGRCMPGTSTCPAGRACDPGTDMCILSCPACTIGGSCYGAGQVNPANPCEVCRTTAPTVWSANDGARCDDGLFCTDADTCSARACSGAPRACGDGVACNGTETCSESMDRCVAGTTTCPAGQVCNTTADTCVTTCSGCVVSGTCYAQGTTDPTNSCQVCDVTRSRSAFSPNDGASCDDGQFCTRGDACSGGLCAGSATDFCSDGVACNGAETCSEATDRCVSGSTTCVAGQVCNPATDMCVTTCSGCVIGGVCYAADTTNPTNPCQICRPSSSTSAWTPNTGASCDDGLFCTAVDTCSAMAVCAGSARDCSDGVACTGTESCNEGTDRCDAGTPTCPVGQFCETISDTCLVTCAGCVIGGTCYPPGAANGACQVCDPLRSTTGWSNRTDGSACDDRLYCTTADVCMAGSCVGGAPRGCEDGYDCNGTETCNETTDSCDAGTTTCMSGTFCDMSVPPPGVCSATCMGTLCGTECVDTDTDPDHCGSCPNVCPTRPNTTRLCGGGSCLYACLPGFLDCNGTMSDGCERAGSSCVGVAPCTATPIPFAMESTAGIAMAPADDSTTGLVPLGFTFRYFGVDYTALNISTNGNAGFGAGHSATFTATDIPVGDHIDNFIAAAFVDLNPAVAGQVRYEQRGSAPSRRFVVSWVDIPWFGGGSTPRVSTQLILYEGTNLIEVHTAYQHAGNTYTQGVENQDGTIACLIPGRSRGNYALTNDAVRFVTNATAEATTVISRISGAEPGEGGLDFTGTFLYAVDIGRGGGSPGSIGDATFVGEPVPGVSVSAENNFFAFGSPDFGASPGDGVLSQIMSDIVWTSFPGPVDISATGLVPGRRYRLQMLFYEACCNRGFDVLVEGTRIADDFSPLVTQGGSIANEGAAIFHTFVATDATLDIRLIGPAPFPDNNPILDGFTLEDLGP